MIIALTFFGVAGLIGYIVGQRNSIPWRKTRYFVDEWNVLYRWKFGSRGCRVFIYKKVDHFSKKKLNWLLVNCQELNSLTAYKMFPYAFPKNKRK
jgi:hypothetical protein